MGIEELKKEGNKKINGGLLLVIAGVFLFIVFIIFTANSCGSDKKGTPTPTAKTPTPATSTPTPTPEIPELDAEVRFSSTAFMIKNKETQNWTSCKFVINGKLFGSDYTYKTTAGISANDSIIVPMSEFTKDDGTRFDPYSIKAKNLFIACEVEGNHRTGYYAISE